MDPYPINVRIRVRVLSLDRGFRISDPGLDALHRNNPSYLKEYFDAINEEKYDHYKHKERITSIEDMGVKMHVFMAKPYQDQFRDQQRVTNDVEDDKAEK